MQKKIIALAVAGLVSGAAFAQSSVTVYGIADVGYNYFSSKDRKYSGINDGATGGLNTSRIGFKGEEALGNGLKAIFQMEYAAEIDNNQVFSQVRQSYVGLAGKYGAVTAGRQYSPSGLWLGNTSSNSITSVHASNYMVGQFLTMQSGGGSRWNNSVAYQSNDMSGFTVRGIYGFGENIRDSFGDTSTDQSRFGLGAQYANGPIYVTALYQAQLDDSTIATNDGNKAWAIGGSYDFKVVKVFANYIRENDDRAAAEVTKKYWSLGASVPVSAVGTIQAEYSQYKTDVDETKSKGYSLGYTHALSKRTTVYTAVSRISNEDATGAGIVRVAGTGVNGESITGFAVGFNHKF